jgi:hypothetical protein
MLVQEDTESVLDKIWGYTANINLGTKRRGIALIARDHLELQEITCLPSGRGIATRLNGVWLVKSTVRGGVTTREGGMYTVELPYLMRTMPDRMLLGGNFK